MDNNKELQYLPKEKGDIKSPELYIKYIIPRIRTIVNVQDTYIEVDSYKLNDITKEAMDMYGAAINKRIKQRSNTHPFGQFLLKGVLFMLKNNLIEVNKRAASLLESTDKKALLTALEAKRLPRGIGKLYLELIPKFDMLFTNTDRFIDTINLILSQLIDPDPDSAKEFIDNLFDPRAYSPEKMTKTAHTQSYNKVQRQLIELVEEYLGNEKTLSQIFMSIIPKNSSNYLDPGYISELFLDDMYKRYIDKYGEITRAPQGRRRKDQ